MEANFFDSDVPSFSYRGGDDMPWCDNDFVISCERAVAEAKEGSSDEFLQERILRLLWALVHSRRLEDLHRGIAILEASLARTNSSLPKRDRLYLLAVGYFRTLDYMMSRYFVHECLMIAPDWRQAQALKKEVEDRIKYLQDDDTGIGTVAVGIAAAGIVAAGIAVGGVAGVAVVAGWIAAALTRKK
ncbi:hypothetical protein I3843_14G114700 [Carya illinoinensis]|uniref:Mitochondrial fission 1 protein n=1 Tax=Carya illinoinensis TaxID=32201 RepID=A0A922AJU0_CARIL|nr:hypothetical protein I3842_14G117000 [Carya illinoinensis]KAG7947842.1 hypothetical protein I3843_14G114700 [Carya illinoinensis]